MASVTEWTCHDLEAPVIVEFSRRKFLLAAGGTTLALPVLETLTPPKALAAYETARRVIFFLTSNGTPVEGRPTGSGKTYTLGKVHEGLAKHRDLMLYVSGLDSSAAMKSNGDPHATGFATSLSGRKCLPGSLFKHGACFMQANCAGTGWGDGPSLDYDLGQQILAAYKDKAGGPVHGMLNFSVKNCPASLYTRSSYSAPGQPITPMADPQVTFDTLFGAPGAGTTDDATAARIALRQTSLLDELKSEISELQGKVSASDRQRLEQHLTAVRELEATLQRSNMRPMSAACMAPTRPTLKAGNLVERNAGGMETNISADKSDNLLERHKVWHQMMLAALACDLTRVITYMTAPSRADTFMPWLSESAATYPGTFTKAHHAASHDDDKPTLIAMDHWYATQISSLVDSLQSTNDAAGKPLLASGAVAWFNELSNGPAHTHDDKPHTIIGSLGGYFKQGQAVAYAKGTSHNVLLTAIAQAMGMQTDHYGGAEFRGGSVDALKA
jgi:Protein of unknown function (DUF1552)